MKIHQIQKKNKVGEEVFTVYAVFTGHPELNDKSPDMEKRNEK